MRSVRISHIVLTTKEVADMILETLQSFGEDQYELMLKTFARLAKKYSACGTRKTGGDLGILEVHTSTPELYKAVMETPEKQLGGPVKTGFGYHVFIITHEDPMGDTGVDGIAGTSLGAGDGTL